MEIFSAQSQEPPKQKSKFQLYLLTGLIGVLVIAVILNVLSFMGKINLKDKNASQSISSSDNANKKEVAVDIPSWKTYKNKKLGYSIKNPLGYKVNTDFSEGSLGSVTFTSPDYKKELTKKSVEGVAAPFEFYTVVEGLLIEIRSTTTKNTLDQAYLYYDDPDRIQNASKKSITLGGKPAYRTKYDYQGALPSDEIMAVHNGRQFLILISIAENSKPELEKEVNQILSTFKPLD